MYALQDLRSFHSLLIAAGLISIIGARFEDRSPRGTGSSLDSIVLVGYSSHRDGRSFIRWTFEHGDGDTDGGCARFIKGWGEKRSMPLTNWMRGICGGCGYFSYRRDLILLTLMDFQAKLVRTRRAGFSAELDSVFHKIVSVSIVLKFGLMAENKLLFLEFPLPRGLGTISIFGIQSGLRGKLHTKGEILGGEKATKRGGIPEISNNTEIPK